MFFKKLNIKFNHPDECNLIDLGVDENDEVELNSVLDFSIIFSKLNYEPLDYQKILPMKI